ncbi:hypothetical protein ACFWXO_21835 [Kitasatospora sp. NPDC059088]|uniref:hypothetical protein n=1 Tax=Kitasatospora sp. NPDC059088 TaxID=3346722 RepID=UPI003683B4B7
MADALLVQDLDGDAVEVVEAFGAVEVHAQEPVVHVLLHEADVEVGGEVPVPAVTFDALDALRGGCRPVGSLPREHRDQHADSGRHGGYPFSHGAGQ